MNRKPSKHKSSPKSPTLVDREPDGARDKADANNSSVLARAEAAHPVSRRRSRRPEANARSDADYELGYARPPKHTQFKPGQSGNPKGRLPQTRNLKTVLKKVLGEHMQIRVGGRVKHMPSIEALVRLVMNRALKGDPRAMAALLVMVKQIGYGTEQAENSPELPPGVDHEAVVRDFIRRFTHDDSNEADSPSDNPTDPSDQPQKGKAR